MSAAPSTTISTAIRNEGTTTTEQSQSQQQQQQQHEHHWTTIPLDDDSNRKYSKPATTTTLAFVHSMIHNNNNMMTNTSLFKHWKGASDFGKAQVQVMIVLLIAYIGNNWKYSYHRNDNHNVGMFWIMNAVLLIAGLCTLQHEPSRLHRSTGQPIIQLLSRPQTEEWKGWMQWAFIMVRTFKVV
jgi:10 TM Acyl Transferase domain found in Cas1p